MINCNRSQKDCREAKSIAPILGANVGGMDQDHNPTYEVTKADSLKDGPEGDPATGRVVPSMKTKDPRRK